jgi:hypothetical protein
MTVERLGPAQLGVLVHNIWKASTDALHVGEFLAAYLQAKPSRLTERQMGDVVVALLQTSMDSNSIGKLIYAEFNLEAIHEYPARAERVGQGVSEKRVIELLEQRLADLDIRANKKPARNTATITINSNKLHTSVSVNRETKDQFIALFGAKRLRGLVKEIAGQNKTPGINRSFMVQKAMEELIGQQAKVAYPHGIKVIHGGA